MYTSRCYIKAFNFPKKICLQTRSGNLDLLKCFYTLDISKLNKKHYLCNFSNCLWKVKAEILGFKEDLFLYLVFFNAY